MKRIVFISMLLLGLYSCAEKGKEKIMVLNRDVPVVKSLSKESSNISNNAVAKKPEPPTYDNQSVPRKIIKEGEISFETGNITATRNNINNSLIKLDGYIAEENQSSDTSSDRKEYTLKVRVPEKNFDMFVNGVSSQAIKIATKNIRVRDVTTDYIDITAQLSNQKKLEERYLELLKKGEKISDLLQIENKLADIRTSIDSTQWQLNYLTKEVEYSTLDITFYTKIIVKDNNQNFGQKLITAISEGWDILGGLFFGVLSTWPIWIILITSYFVFREWRKKHPIAKKVAAIK